MSRYKNNYLSNAILRIDFVADEKQLIDSINSDLKATCIRLFPIVEERKVETQEFQINKISGNTIINRQTSIEWHFYGKNREKELTLTNNCIFVDYKDYISFDMFKGEFNEVLLQLLKAYPQIKISRIGLRYVDQIDLSCERTNNKSWLTFWNKYINTQLIKSLSFVDDDKCLTRNMSSIEMNYGDYSLRFQYGIFNDDYPAPNKKPVFILDTDLYAVGIYTVEEMQEFLTAFHDRAKEWFEKSIKQSLREKMGVLEQDDEIRNALG